MLKKDLLIECDKGILGEVAARITNVASRFISIINIENGEKKANAKSLLGILSLEICNGDNITICVNGNDEKNAIEEIAKCLK